MKKIILFGLLISVAMHVFSQDYIVFRIEGITYDIPVIYPIIFTFWLMIFSYLIGQSMGAWRHYWDSREILHQKNHIEFLQQQRDEARWIVAECARGQPLLRLNEIAEDYRAIENPSAAILAEYRMGTYSGGQTKSDLLTSSHLLEQSLKEERILKMALQIQDQEECYQSLALLQGLPWDFWKDRQVVSQVLSHWSQWKEPIQLFLIAKISPVFWTKTQLEALYMQIVASLHSDRWMNAMKKGHWDHFFKSVPESYQIKLLFK